MSFEFVCFMSVPSPPTHTPSPNRRGREVRGGHGGSSQDGFSACSNSEEDIEGGSSPLSEDSIRVALGATTHTTHMYTTHAHTTTISPGGASVANLAALFPRLPSDLLESMQHTKQDHLRCNVLACCNLLAM